MKNNEKKQNTKRDSADLAELVMWALLGFFMAVLITINCNCATWRLPDRDHSHCKIPWENRITCVIDAGCPADHVCARRRAGLGKCTYIDCCDPWRHGPRLLGADWCEFKENSEDN